MANSKIKQILVGTTTYDIEDASAAHKASDNTFTGSNTFSSAITAKQGIISANGDNLLDKAKLNYNSISRHTNNKDYTLTIPTKDGTLATTGDITDIEANPTASGTTALTKLKIGPTVYTLPSGETYEVVELTSSQTTLTDDQYNTLIASPFNKIKYENKIYNLYQDTTSELVYTVNHLNTGYRILINKDTKNIIKNSSTCLTEISSFVKNNLTYSTSNTTYALSAYQGKVLNDRLEALKDDIPTVIANPTASGTATLTKLKVGSTVYTLPSGGGVLSFGGKTGYITLSDGLSMNNNQLVSKIKNIYTDASGYLCIETNE